MAQRITLRTRKSYNTPSNRRRIVKTPGTSIFPCAGDGGLRPGLERWRSSSGRPAGSVRTPPTWCLLGSCREGAASRGALARVRRATTAGERAPQRRRLDALDALRVDGEPMLESGAGLRC